VTVLEQTNARALTIHQIDRDCDWVVCDASFISLAKVLEVPLALAAPNCRLVALIKPQFEARREEVGKGGIIRDPAIPPARVRRGAQLAGRAGLGGRRAGAQSDHRHRRQRGIPDQRTAIRRLRSCPEGAKTVPGRLRPTLRRAPWPVTLVR